jgi:hypothetical protein
MRLFLTFVHSTILTLTAFVLMASVLFVSAQTRTSPNYQLQSDSVNVGGGLSDSASYSIESTTGEVATGLSDSATFSLRAGYQQMQEVFISLAGGADIVMSPALPGITGGEANGSSTFTVVTDSPAGYNLTIQAANNPAMQRGDGPSINNYTPTSTADFAFSIPAASAEFGFTPQGADVVAAFLDNGTTCGVGTTDTAFACWAPILDTTTEIARGTAANQPAGATTSVLYRVGITNGAVVPEGQYTATTTVTALPL